jgi:MoaA/NifB/PqqE/SkfB family radical SAM enzyme
MFRSIQNKNLPNLMSFAINDDCNAGCKHCSFFSGVDDKTKQILSTDEAKRVIREAQEIGVSTINIVGGEPTLRKDLTDLIRSVDKDLTQVIMFTNGSLIKELAGKLKKAGLDGVYVSIDWSTAEKHDKHRMHKGLFEKAMAGIAEAKRVGLTVGISTCMTPESTADGEFERMVELGKRLGVHEIIVFDAMPTGRFKFRKDLVDNPDWVEDLISRSKQFNADETYPGILVWGYATSHRSVGCTCGTSYFYLSPYGDIMSCDFNHAAFGNIREKPLFMLWDGLTTKKEFCSAKWGGCKIKDSTTRDGATVTSGKGCSGC